MLSEVATHIQHRIANAPIQTDPFPHFYVENVFPDRFYQDLLSHLPALGVYQPLKEQGLVTDTEELYKDRYIIHFREEALEQFDAADRGIWRDFTNWLSGETVVSLALDKFASLVTERFGNILQDISFGSRTQLLRDFTNFSLGPHTDAPWKAVVFVFYLPADAEHVELGTSLYVPNDPSFTCEGGPHYRHVQFRKVATAEYKPNTMLGFFKSSSSFHGVEPVTTPNAQRDLIQYSVTWRKDD